MAEIFTPLYDKLLVKKEEEKATIGMGVIVPESAKDRPDRGTVVEAGHGRLLDDGTVIPMIVKRGDRVLFGKYSGTEIKLDGKEYIILDEPEIFGVLKEEK